MDLIQPTHLFYGQDTTTTRQVYDLTAANSPQRPVDAVISGLRPKGYCPATASMKAQEFVNLSIPTSILFRMSMQ